MQNKVKAHICSLRGAMAEVTLLEKIGDNDYLVEYNGIKCHALFNWFAGSYYVDDIYGIVK